MQASDTKQQELTENGIATVYREEPGFDMVDVYQGDDPEDDGSWVNMYGGRMYDGIIPDENGHPVYEDGSIISYYTDSSGDMEYIIQAGIVDLNDSLLGKTIHVNFKDLGFFSKGKFTPAVEGNWNFRMILPDVSSAKDIEVGQKVEGTGFVMESISISPVSMKVNYSVIEVPEIREDENGIPRVQGVVLKDGTRLPYLTDGGKSGYTDSTKTHAYHMAGYDRVIDVDEVDALIVQTLPGNETVEIPIL